ncbi:MAG: GGDEF domain-containing phosphodiesterase, partial [Acholeplasmataceae bacterium]
TASIAVVFYPMHGETLKELLKSMQIALYLIKKNGGNAVRIYSNDMGEHGEHIEYYYQIKHAIQHKEFQLYYQPIIDVKNKDIYGVETLIRWNHPEHGLLAPNQFLGVMEQSGDIHWIGLWGLETLIKTHQELDQTFPSKRIYLTLNLSPKQLINDLLPSDFQKILKKYRMNPEFIVLEIIEFALFEKETTIFKNLKKLKDMGFKIAIDGFGLDYQTLSKVDKLDIDIIKLDNEFLQAEEYMKGKFASLLVEYAEKNQYDIICESIEDSEMLNQAISYDVKYLQGFYLAKPMSSEALKGYIGTKHWNELI